MAIKFTDRILDNVHGFIEYTDAEKAIMNTLLFKRLQSIKQLSIANWIFPGSEHTRYIHSLGVMHIADKMAVQLEVPDEERKIIRMAGLLHDIGHYPLSHVCEAPYKKNMEDYQKERFCQSVNQDVRRYIETFSLPVTKEFMVESIEGNHEAVGASIIYADPEIRKILTEECGEASIDIICDMITGSVKRHMTNPLWVQMLHSEIDADGIDYMMRDAAFAGTGFGSFEMQQLIRCLEKRVYDGKEILCIHEKGIAAADQYLINKFFSYSQVVFNKHISNLEWMAEIIVDWMLKKDELFPTKEKLLKRWINAEGNFDNYLGFTDNFFWKALDEIKTSPKKYYAPKYIVALSKKLLDHEELPFVDGSEIRMISKDAEEIKDQLYDSAIYREHIDSNKKIILCSQKPITKNISYQHFVNSIEANIAEELQEDKEQYVKDKVLSRYMEGMCVCNSRNEEIHLLCDDERSLMKQLCGSHLVILRAFEFPLADEGGSGLL